MIWGVMLGQEAINHRHGLEQVILKSCNAYQVEVILASGTAGTSRDPQLLKIWERVEYGLCNTGQTPAGAER